MKKIMTNIKTLAALLMASATFAACSSDDNTIDQQPAQPAGQQVYTMTVNAQKGGDAATTRALTLDGKTLNATWATTENIYVKKGETWATGSLQPQADGTTATLKGELSGITIAAGDVLTLQFPKSGDISYDGQAGTLEDIAANFDYATATATVASVSATGNINPTEATTTFQNQQAIVKFTLVDKGTNAAINATKLTVSDGTNSYTITPASATSEIYVAIPGIADKTVTLTATVGEDTYTFEKTGVTFTNGKYYAIAVKMAKEAAAIDLSMVDCAGTARASQWTANCYMVHTAGDYKLPLVYGNAIKNGETNTAAYTGVTSSNTTATFPRHDGNAITAPWIKDNGITVASAALLWQDADGLVTAVGIDGDYLTLTVGKDAATQEGNALVAAKTSDGTIVWSWHIWVTKQTFADLTTVATGSHDYKVTPVNLGWVGDATSATGYNTYYQWGRKDAFIPSTGSNNTNHTVYDISGATVTGFTYEANTTATIADNIKNPTTHYYNSTTKGSCSTKFYNMWDAKETSGGENIATATVKTVYDPCPAGFCVPTGNLYYYIKNGSGVSFTWDSTNMGRSLTSVTPNVFFPASGCRYGSSGSLYNVGSLGYYWSASAYSSNANYARYLYFPSGSWNWDYGSRSLGVPVRAVTEK